MRSSIVYAHRPGYNVHYAWLYFWQLDNYYSLQHRNVVWLRCGVFTERNLFPYPVQSSRHRGEDRLPFHAPLTIQVPVFALLLNCLYLSRSCSLVFYIGYLIHKVSGGICFLYILSCRGESPLSVVPQVLVKNNNNSNISCKRRHSC